MCYVGFHVRLGKDKARSVQRLPSLYLCPSHSTFATGWALKEGCKKNEPRKPCYGGSSGSVFVAVVVVVVVVAAAEALLVLVVVMAVVVGTWWCCYTLKDTRLYQTVLKSLTARKLHLLPRFSLHEPRLCT